MKQAHRSAYFLVALALLAGVAGYFGAWVPHRAAGLVITGIDLGEYVKFLPGYRAGQISFRREIFYLPLFAASVSFALLAGRRSLPSWARVVAGLAAIPLALAMLPPAWTPAIVGDPEYRVQLTGIFLCLALLVPGLVLTRYLPDRLVLGVIALLGVSAAIAPVWGFLQIHAPIEALYRSSLPIGWGVLVAVAGYLAAAVIALAESLRRQ